MPAIRRLVAVLFLVAALAVLAVATPAAATADATKCAAYAVLKPANEVPPTTSKTLGAAAIRIDGTTLSFAVTIANPLRETFIAGHIHIGAAGVNGPVRVALFTGPPNDRTLFFQAAQIQISAENATAICTDLAGHYVNYHTTQFPGGALRGQLVGI